MTSRLPRRLLSSILSSNNKDFASVLRPYPRLPRTLQPYNVARRFKHSIPKPPQSLSPSPSPSSTPSPSPSSTPSNSTNGSSASSPTQEKTRKQLEPHYQLTFTCVPCSSRSSHTVSKQGYHHGSVLITCPSCRNRHIISDHLGIFGDRKITVEDLMRERGRLVKRGTLGEDGDVEFWENETTSSQEDATVDDARQELSALEEENEATRLRKTKHPSIQSTINTTTPTSPLGAGSARPSVHSTLHTGSTPSTRRGYSTRDKCANQINSSSMLRKIPLALPPKKPYKWKSPDTKVLPRALAGDIPDVIQQPFPPLRAKRPDDHPQSPHFPDHLRHKIHSWNREAIGVANLSEDIPSMVSREPVIRQIEVATPSMVFPQSFQPPQAERPEYIQRFQTPGHLRHKKPVLGRDEEGLRVADLRKRGPKIVKLPHIPRNPEVIEAVKENAIKYHGWTNGFFPVLNPNERFAINQAKGSKSFLTRAPSEKHAKHAAKCLRTDEVPVQSINVFSKVIPRNSEFVEKVTRYEVLDQFKVGYKEYQERMSQVDWIRRASAKAGGTAELDVDADAGPPSMPQVPPTQAQEISQSLQGSQMRANTVQQAEPVAAAEAAAIAAVIAATETALEWQDSALASLEKAVEDAIRKWEWRKANPPRARARAQAQAQAQAPPQAGRYHSHHHSTSEDSLTQQNASSAKNPPLAAKETNEEEERERPVIRRIKPRLPSPLTRRMVPPWERRSLFGPNAVEKPTTATTTTDKNNDNNNNNNNNNNANRKKKRGFDVWGDETLSADLRRMIELGTPAVRSESESPSKFPNFKW